MPDTTSETVLSQFNFFSPPPLVKNFKGLTFKTFAKGDFLEIVFFLFQFLEESRLITHYWFTSWPDHKVPKSCSDIISLAKDVRSAVETAQLTKDCGPVVVHCR